MFFARKAELEALTSRFEAMVRNQERRDEKLAEMEKFLDQMAALTLTITDLRNREYDNHNRRLMELKKSLPRPWWKRLRQWLKERREIDTDPTQSVRVPGTRGTGSAGK